MINFLIGISVAFAAESVSVTPRDEIIKEMTSMLLAGESAPKDIEQRLQDLSPSDRFEVVIFLRRSGMLSGPVLSMDKLLEVEIPQGD